RRGLPLARPRGRPGRDRGRHPALAGRPLQRAAPDDPRSRGAARRPAHAPAERCRDVAGDGRDRSRRGDRGGPRRRHDAARAARAHARGLLPARARVLHRVGPRRRAARPASGGYDCVAPRTHESRARDFGACRRLAPGGHPRPGHQRCVDTDGGALPRALRLGSAGGRGVTTTLIRGARLPDGSTQDLLIEDGVIAERGGSLSRAGARVIDADGLIALPGLVDLHTHLREPGFEQSETVLTGTRAAAAGGFTAVFAMANTSPVADTAGVVEQVASLGAQHGYATVRPIGAVTVGLAGERLAEIGAMSRSRAAVRVFSD